MDAAGWRRHKHIEDSVHALFKDLTVQNLNIKF